MTTTTITAAPSIVRIISVTDTREFEEQGDRLVPVPGSGNARPCDRCGRDHEIHVDVELSDGTTALIGQGCARGDSMEAAVKASVSAATTLAKLRRQHARITELLAAAMAAWAIVEAMPLPEVVVVEEIPHEHGVRRIYGMGDARAWTLPGCAFDAERRSCLVNGWRNNRYIELTKGTGRYWPDSYRGQLAELGTRIRKQERKLAELAR